MPASLIIPPCEQSPAHLNHLPRPDKPLRVQIFGLGKIIDQVFDDGTKIAPPERPVVSAVNFDQPSIRLAKMAFKLLYGRDVNPDDESDFVPRYQHNTFYGKRGEVQPWEHVVDGYAITFDHLVPADDEDPETLMMNFCDPGDPEITQYLRFDPGRYKTDPEASVLLVPRCCQVRRGTTDRARINDQVRGAREQQQSGGEADSGTS